MGWEGGRGMAPSLQKAWKRAVAGPSPVIRGAEWAGSQQEGAELKAPGTSKNIFPL